LAGVAAATGVAPLPGQAATERDAAAGALGRRQPTAEAAISTKTAARLIGLDPS
jgi:hypothetical protein